jgi:hypothetical protein
VVFAIGRALCGHVNMEARTIFNCGQALDSQILGSAEKAIAFYESQLYACRLAVNTWTEVGIHFHVVKDIRKLISKLIWDSRGEALYRL